MSSFLHRRSMAAGLLLCGLVTSLVVPGTGLHRPLQAQEKATAARPDTDADEVDSSEFAGVEDPELAARVFAIFEQRCESCHSEADNSAGLDVTSKLSMFSTGSDETAQKFVKPGDPVRSRIWTAIRSNSMPMDGDPLTKDEKALVLYWITVGAPFPAVEESKERKPMTRLEELQAVHADLNRIDRNDRKRQRYFSIRLQQNDPALKESDLALYRAAFSKAINSLSRGPQVIVPASIEPTQTVFRIDLQDFGWDFDVWDEVVAAYPYGLEPVDPRNNSLNDVYQDVKQLYGLRFDGFATIRVDWFISTATRPPLYHTLLNIPDTLDAFETQMGVNRTQDIQQNPRSYLRFGVTESGVSAQNRIADRHVDQAGRYYWISYDFVLNSGKGNITRFPLGPEFEGNEHNQFAFEHDGGEVVYQLNNGLQGYMLATADGARIDEGPVSIVWDRGYTSGTPAIVNGLSCMVCHVQGMKYPRDRKYLIRDSLALFGEDKKAAEDRQPGWDDLMDVLNDDRDNFLRALHRAVSPFLPAADGAELVKKYPEPIKLVVQNYLIELSLEDAARELDVEPGDLSTAIRLNSDLVQLGLGPLTTDNTLQRSMWDFREPNGSPLQRAAAKLQIGIPVVTVRSASNTN